SSHVGSVAPPDRFAVKITSWPPAGALAENESYVFSVVVRSAQAPTPTTGLSRSAPVTRKLDLATRAEPVWPSTRDVCAPSLIASRSPLVLIEYDATSRCRPESDSKWLVQPPGSVHSHGSDGDCAAITTTSRSPTSDRVGGSIEIDRSVASAPVVTDAERYEPS